MAPAVGHLKPDDPRDGPVRLCVKRIGQRVPGPLSAQDGRKFGDALAKLGLVRDETPAQTVSVVPYWGVEDVESAVAHLTGLGAKVTEKPTNVGGEIVVAAVSDPLGNALGVIYNPDFKVAS